MSKMKWLGRDIEDLTVDELREAEQGVEDAQRMANNAFQADKDELAAEFKKRRVS